MARETGKVPPAVLERVQRQIADHAGLSLPDWVVEARLADRLRALAIDEPAGYAELLASDAGRRELELLLETLRVGETRFFRHRSHVNAVTDIVVPALAALDPKTPIRAWSAGCASGEEPYTLAMVLRRQLGVHRNISVLATDISADAVEAARAAVYPEAALAHVPADWRDYGFEEAGDDERGRAYYRIAAPIRKLVEVERRNLADPGFRRGFQIIWCRNVLIYFAPEARRDCVARLIDSLEPGGFLFLGYAETLRDFDRVEAVRAPDAVLYRKSDATPAARKPVAPRRSETPAPVFRRRAPKLPAVVAEEAVIELRGRYEDEARLSKELAAVMSGPYAAAVVDLDGADYLSDGAAAVLRRARSAARAAGMQLSFAAERPGHRRFLRRFGLLDDGGSQ